MHYPHHSGCGCHEHQESGHGHHGHQRDCGCGCHGGHHGAGLPHRRFMSREETIKHLEDYLQQLQSEAKGVGEHLEKLKSGQ